MVKEASPLVCPSCAGPKTRRAKLCADCRRGAPAREKVSRANGMEVVSVFGAFNSRVLLHVSAEFAESLLDGEPFSAFPPTAVIDGIRRDLAQLDDEKIAESGMAGAALSLAMTIENPYTSATARAACAKELRETMAALRALAPPKEEPTFVDDLAARAAAKLRVVQ